MLSSGNGGTPGTPRRLAVLPFEVFSAGPGSALFGRALCMSMTASLTNLEGVEAVAHGYLSAQPLREATADLNLSHVIHGSVLECGGRCRVVVNLIQASEGAQIWAREYDFEAGELLEAQSGIAADLRDQVNDRLGRGRLPAQPARRGPSLVSGLAA
jgi:adenylate cyclase